MSLSEGNLSYHGLRWARALLNSGTDSVTIGCSTPQDPSLFPTLVTVELDLERPLTCSVRETAVKSWPTTSRKVLDRTLRGAEQLLALVDPRGLPWAEIEIGDQVHLFDPSGRERARVLRAFDQDGSRLALRCWDESGYELSEDSQLPS